MWVSLVLSNGAEWINRLDVDIKGMMGLSPTIGDHGSSEMTCVTNKLMTRIRLLTILTLMTLSMMTMTWSGVWQSECQVTRFHCHYMLTLWQSSQNYKWPGPLTLHWVQSDGSNWRMVAPPAPARTTLMPHQVVPYHTLTECSTGNHDDYYRSMEVQ